MSKLTLADIKQKIEKDRQQDAKRAAELEQLHEQIAALDEKIDAALNADQPGTAEQLIEQQNKLKQRIPTMERIAQHKSDPTAYLQELVEICKEHVEAAQPKADKTVAELEKAYMEYLRKKAALAKILYDATEFRCECGTLAGLSSQIGLPGFNVMPCVEVKGVRDVFNLHYTENEDILAIDPDYHIHFNQYCLYGTPR